MPYPWGGIGNVVLTSTDLNTAFAQAYALGNTASANAAAALAAAAGPKPVSVSLNWPSPLAVTAGTYVVSASVPYPFTIGSLIVAIGSVGGSITASLLDNGTPVSAYGAVLINQSARTVIAPTGSAPTIAAGDTLSVFISGISGTPTDSYITLLGTHT